MQYFITLLLTLIPITLAASSSGHGSVSLWSDSSCQPGATPNFGEQDPVALNYTLAADDCSTLSSTAHSYIVNERPTCANGSTAAFAYYNGAGCQVVGFGPALNQVQTRTDVDGLCLALVEFNSIAFLCGGIGSGDASVASTSPKATSTSSPEVASATPLTPGLKVTTPLYTTTPFTAGSPAATTASGTGVSAAVPTGTLASSPTKFTGGVGRIESSMMGLVAAGGMVLML